MRIYARNQVCGFRFNKHNVGRLQQLPAPGGPDPGRPLDVPERPSTFIKPASSPPDRNIQQRNRRSADGEGGRSHRPHAGSRHRSRLERAACRRHALGAAHEARGERGRDRCGARRHRRPAHRRRVCARPLGGAHGPSPAASRAGTSSDASGWSSASSFATTPPPPTPATGPTASRSAALPAAPAFDAPRRWSP